MNFLSKLFLKRIIFKRIREVDVIIFGYDKFNFDSDIKFAYFQNSEINLRYLIPTFIMYINKFFTKKKMSIIDTYFVVLLRKYNCKIALGNDRDNGVFKFKKFFPNKISVAYQFGYWFEELVNLGQTVIRNKFTDYYFLFDDRTRKFTENFVKANYLITGSVSSNEKIFKNLKKKYDFMFISNFRYKIKKNSNNLIEKTMGETSSKNLLQCSSFMLKTLSNFCNERQKTFCIARVGTRVDKKKYFKLLKEENNFLKQYARNFFLEEVDSFELAQQSEVSICTHSNLGYQLLARGNKVLFLNRNEDVYNWHFINSSSGPFWYKGSNISEINKKLEDILRMSKKEWDELVKESLIPIKFDPGNKVLKGLINKIMSKSIDREVRH